MKLRSLLHRRRPDRVPPPPLIEPDDRRSADPASAPPTTSRRTTPLTDEERLERLLTPTELELVLQHRISLETDSTQARPRDNAAS